MPAFDAADGSTTSTCVPRMWVLLMLPRFGRSQSCKWLHASVTTLRSRLTSGFPELAQGSVHRRHSRRRKDFIE
jgi:hypothetical protein